MRTCTLFLAGFKRPFKVTLGSPRVGVFVIFKVREDAAVALSIPNAINEIAMRIEKERFTT